MHGEAFRRAADLALSEVGFAVPRGGEVAVVVFDGAAWAGWDDEAASLLDAEEGRRAARFRFARDRQAYVMAHAMWRVLLGRCLACHPAAARVVPTSTGQPTLPGTPWATSLSHSAHWVALAVGQVAALGVDIEQSPSPRPLVDMVSTICAPPEALALRHLEGAAHAQALLQLWTRKEALLKAFGTGLSGPPPASFAVPAGMPLAPPADNPAPPCRVDDLALPSAVVGALARPDTCGAWRTHILG